MDVVGVDGDLVIIRGHSFRRLFTFKGTPPTPTTPTPIVPPSIPTSCLLLLLLLLLSREASIPAACVCVCMYDVRECETMIKYKSAGEEEKPTHRHLAVAAVVVVDHLLPNPLVVVAAVAAGLLCGSVGWVVVWVSV